DDNVLQMAEKSRPFRMVRQDRGVQHIRVRQHQIRLGLDAPALRGGRIAIENTGPNPRRNVRTLAEYFEEALELILREGFGWKQIQGPRLRIGQSRFQNRQVVAERL